MIRRRLPALLLAALLGVAAAACGGDDEAQPDSRGTPVQTPTGSPFSLDVEGPATATPGEQVTATLTNTGRLPDSYRLVPNPFSSATIAEPEVRLAPGESAQVTMIVNEAPLTVIVQSISAGQGGEAGELSIGATQ